MRTLSFDTTTNALHVCLLNDREPMHQVELTPEGAERQEVASLLMPQIDALFKQSGWDKRTLDAIVVGTGPGSFTGIRVAVVTARTLAQFLNLPLMPVSLLETLFIASQLPTAAVVVSTTSQQFFYGAFEAAADDPCKELMPCGFGTREVVEAALAGNAIWLCDEKAAAAMAGEGGGAGAGAGVEVRPLPVIKNLAAIQAQLAYDRLSLRRLAPATQEERATLAETFPWRDVLPLYLRSPSVTVKKTYATSNPPHERK